MRNQAGDCELLGSRRKRFKIRVNKDLSEDSAVLVLLHEIAHAITWDSDDVLPGDHNAFWGIAYSQVYKTWMGVL